MNTVITGATKGLGRAIALKFAAGGHHLGLCARNEVDLQTFKTELETNFPDIKIYSKMVDVSIKSQVLDFATDLISYFGRIDVLINNAGVFIPGAISEEKDGSLENMIQTNLFSAYHLTRALLPAMLPYRSASIFNMCSIASKDAYPNGGSYSISKFALLGFSKVLRAELKDKGIKVTAVLPGATWSDSWSGVDLPFERLMEAKDIADLIWATYKLGPSAVVEEIVIRPQLGDL